MTIVSFALLLSWHGLTYKQVAETCLSSILGGCLLALPSCVVSLRKEKNEAYENEIHLVLQLKSVLDGFPSHLAAKSGKLTAVFSNQLIVTSSRIKSISEKLGIMDNEFVLPAHREIKSLLNNAYEFNLKIQEVVSGSYIDSASWNDLCGFTKDFASACGNVVEILSNHWSRSVLG